MLKSEGNMLIIENEVEKFSVFRIEGNLLRYGEESRRMDFIMFGRSGKFDYSDKIYNPGERNLEIYTNSKEEAQELYYLFFSGRFKIRKFKHKNRHWKRQKERVWIDPRTLKLIEDRNYSWTPGLGPAEYKLNLKLFRKDLQKFLDFLKKISKENKYKTFYFDTEPSNDKLNKLILK